MLQNAKVTTLTSFELQLVVIAEFPLQVLPFLGGGKILPTPRLGLSHELPMFS